MFNKKNKPLTMRDMLISYHNNFTEKLMAHTLDLKRHIDIVKENPDFTRPNPGGPMGGPPIPIQELIRQNKEGIDNNREYLKNIDYLLSIDDEELLEDVVNRYKTFDPPMPAPKMPFKVLKDVEYPRGTVHKKNAVLQLNEKQAGGFAKGLIEKVEEKKNKDK